MSSPQDIAALEQFIVDPDLRELESHVARFNIFDALDLRRRELQHSNFLAWLLNPAESHGQGATFLRAFLRASQVAASVSKARVVREWTTDAGGRVDLLIELPRAKTVVAIEHKIDAPIANDLNEYCDSVKSRFQGFHCRFRLLIPTTATSTPQPWEPVRHEDIYRHLKAAHGRLRRDPETNELRIALGHYLKLLWREFMGRQELDELCRKIYDKHQQAVNLILDRVSALGDIAGIAVAVRRDPRWVVGRCSDRSIDIWPRDWETTAPWMFTSDSERTPAIYWIIWRTDDKLFSRIRVYALSDATLRGAVADAAGRAISDMARSRRRGRPNPQGRELSVSRTFTVAAWKGKGNPFAQSDCAQKIERFLREQLRVADDVSIALKPALLSECRG